MRRFALLLALAALVPSPASLAARAVPDFSGTWVFDADHSSKTETGYGAEVSNGVMTRTTREVPLRPIWGDSFTAKQDAKALSITRTITPATPAMTMNGVTTPAKQGESVTYSVTYALDGSETRNTIPSASLGRPATEMIVTATWEGEKLVTATWNPATPSAPKLIRSLRIDANGVLLVDATNLAPAGMTPATSTSTTAYKRALNPY